MIQRSGRVWRKAYCSAVVFVRLSNIYLFVCPVGILTVTHQGAACDMANVHLFQPNN